MGNTWVNYNFNSIASKAKISGKKVKQKDYTENGDLPIVDQGEGLVGGYTNSLNYKVECDLPVIIYGDHTKCVKYIDFPFAPGADGVKVLIPNKVSILTKLFYYFLKVIVQKIPDKGYSRHFKYLEKEEIPVPPFKEQHRIVAKIEELFSELDNGVANLEKTKDQLQTYRQSVLKHAFEGQLTATWRQHYAVSANPEPTPPKAAKTPNAYTKPAQGQLSLLPQFETQPASTHIEDLPGPELLEHIKAERQRQYEAELETWEQQAREAKANGRKKPPKPRKPKEMEPLTEVEQQQLPTLPEGWCWARFGDISKAIGGYAFKSKNLLEHGKYQVIKIANIKMGFLDLASAPAFLDDVNEGIKEKYGLQNGDCIISLTGTRKKRDYGNVALVTNQKNLLLNQRLGAVRFDHPLCPRFFFYSMMTEVFRDNFFKYETGNVGQGNVSMKALQEEPIFLPSVREQKQIVREIESRLSAADSMESGIDQSLQQAESLRQSILKKAFEGTLVEDDEGAEAEKT